MVQFSIESTIKTVVGERYFLKLLEMKIDQKLNEGNRAGKPKQGPKHVDTRRPTPESLVTGGRLITDPKTGDFQAEPFRKSRRSRAEDATKLRRQKNKK